MAFRSSADVSDRDALAAVTRNSGASWVTDPKIRGWVFQAIAVAIVAYLAISAGMNAHERLVSQNIGSGFGFLEQSSGFAISQTLIPYSESSTHGRVFLVGVLNTLLVAAIGIVFATILGFSIGVARLSGNWVIARFATVYVEVMRNLPPLFHILFWYMAVLSTLPSVRESLRLGGTIPIAYPSSVAFQGSFLPSVTWVPLFEITTPYLAFLNIRGLYLPWPVLETGAGIVIGVFALAVLAALGLRRWAYRRQMATGQTFPAARAGLGIVVVATGVALAATAFPFSTDMPVLRGFNFVGGLRLTPEFVALTAALSIYTAGFIAEIVRAGIQAVSRGQTEAAYALGLSPAKTRKLVVVPQAMRVIVPPLTSQYLNLTKNSSLAVVIGYPDLVAVFAGTSLNNTGRAIEILTITMAFYLVVSLLTAGVMNAYNRRIALVER